MLRLNFSNFCRLGVASCISIIKSAVIKIPKNHCQKSEIPPLRYRPERRFFLKPSKDGSTVYFIQMIEILRHGFQYFLERNSFLKLLLYCVFHHLLSQRHKQNRIIHFSRHQQQSNHPLHQYQKKQSCPYRGVFLRGSPGFAFLAIL